MIAETVPWTPLVLVSLAPLAGLLAAGREARTGRGGFIFWLAWAGLVFPGGALFLLLLAGPQAAPLWSAYFVLWLGQLFVLGGKTAQHLCATRAGVAGSA
jgi:hypothetical protein